MTRKRFIYRDNFEPYSKTHHIHIHTRMPRQRLDYMAELGPQRSRELWNRYRPTAFQTSLGCLEAAVSFNTDGYSQIWAKKTSNLSMVGRKSQTAFLLHIVAFVASTGRAPVNHCSHLCDNRRCFNPVHLVDETAADNNARKGCWGDIVCPDHGHILVQFCVHLPKCVRPPMTGQHVQCCLSMQVAEDHPSKPSLKRAFFPSSSLTDIEVPD